MNIRFDQTDFSVVVRTGLPPETMEMGDLSGWSKQSGRVFIDLLCNHGLRQPGRKRGPQAALDRVPYLTAASVCAVAKRPPPLSAIAPLNKATRRQLAVQNP